MYRNSIWNSLRWGEISPEVHCTLIIFLYFILITLQCHPHVVKPEMMELTNQVHHHYDLWLTDSETLWTSCSTPHSCSMRLSSIGLPKLKKKTTKKTTFNQPSYSSAAALRVPAHLLSLTGRHYTLACSR